MSSSNSLSLRMTSMNGGLATAKETLVPIVVDYDLPIRDLIAEGPYTLVSPEISIASPSSRDTGRKSVYCVVGTFGVFDRRETANSEDAIQAITSRGFRCATLQELLTFAANFGERPEHHTTIVALGSELRSQGRACAASLTVGHLLTFSLSLKWFDGPWYRGIHQFLAVAG